MRANSVGEWRSDDVFMGGEHSKVRQVRNLLPVPDDWCDTTYNVRFGGSISLEDCFKLVSRVFLV